MTAETLPIQPALLIFAAPLIAAFSGVPLLAVRYVGARFGQCMATLFMAAASIVGIAGAVLALLHRTKLLYQLIWPLPFAPSELCIDPLAAFFYLPILVVSSCCSIYGLAYWPAEKHSRTVRKLTFFFGLLVASMLFVVIAHSAGIFLMAWEIMALSAYFLLTTEDHDNEVREAGTLYMVCTHTGTLALFALFALMNRMTGNFSFPEAGSLTAVQPFATAFFLTALFGFGFKAGVMPLHVWLPSAHANAPSHISAIMSGVILKIGIYGLLRTLSFFSAIPLWWGVLVLLLGIISGIVGVLYALGQHDIKRLLAYHSIENIGIILIGVGSALIGMAVNSLPLAVLGISGALLHVFNHAVFKALLFLGAGSVIHSLGTREIDRMGGVLRYKPWTALAFITGAVAICGLPPLNGFVSELLIYLGLFTGVINNSGAAIAGLALAPAALAITGGLAVACFVKVAGTVFLGSPRMPQESLRHCESPGLMLAPMAFLAIICILVGTLPFLTVPFLDSLLVVFSQTANYSTLEALAPVYWISALAIALLLSVIFLFIFYRRKLAQRDSAVSSTWGCGYLAPTQRMQYTASSFAGLLVGFFSGVLSAERHPPDISGHFPESQDFKSHIPETILEKFYLPLLNYLYEKTLPIRKLQHGQLHLYILYILLTLVILIFAAL